MSSNIGEFLEARVWPELDAVASGLLDALKPQKNGNSYKLNCPSCGKRRAYYYPTKSIKCNRIESCSYTGTIWNYLLEYQGLSKKEVVQTVCGAVGVEPPDSRANTKPSPQTSVDTQVIRILQASFPDCMGRLKEKWGYSDQDLQVLSRYCGYYISPEYLRSKLPEKSHEEADNLGWFAPSLSNRLFGWWKQPSGSQGYWARALDSAEPKYLFRSGMVKNLPYLSNEASPNKPLIGVEGGRDVLALKLMGYKNAIGVGGAFFTFPQCRYLATQFPRIIHVVDGDIAGLKGVIKTLENASEFGLHFEFVIVPPDSGRDADDYRQDDDAAGFKKLFDNRVSAGVALAMAYAKLQTENHLNDLLGKILSTKAALAPSDQQDFTQTLKQLGINLDIHAEAIHDLSQLLNYFSFAEANRIIADRYGFSLEIIRSGIDG